jgi:hypothetical protein
MLGFKPFLADAWAIRDHHPEIRHEHYALMPVSAPKSGRALQKRAVGSRARTRVVGPEKGAVRPLKHHEK